MKLVIIESPFAGDVEANIAYARRAVKDCLARGESPYASHLFFTQPGVLDDTKPEERKLGIEAGFAWGAAAESVVFYIDRGWSAGMVAGIDRAVARGATIQIRKMDTELSPDDMKPLLDAMSKHLGREVTTWPPCETPT